MKVTRCTGMLTPSGCRVNRYRGDFRRSIDERVVFTQSPRLVPVDDIFKARVSVSTTKRGVRLAPCPSDVYNRLLVGLRSSLIATAARHVSAFAAGRRRVAA